jgi:hypothetical protein
VASLLLTWDAKSYNAGSLKTCVQRFSHKPKSLQSAGPELSQLDIRKNRFPRSG